MALEVELKFIDVDHESLKENLKSVSAEFLSAHFEKNIVLDDPGRTLYKRSALLRIREAGKTVMTVKRIPCLMPESGKAKVYEEYQSEISSLDEMISCLAVLGYYPVFRYEKFREKWQYDNCIICVDTLPFGYFVEIEGNEDDIIRCADALDLDISTSSKKTYHELNREYRAQNGYAADENFVFSDEQRLLLPMGT
ncbi:class IV adenylate cyclase [Maridesulfovibrio bastinii]|uniref:class IV adenylate cyclase n=1 Tax=Maridesulfovibrio bastinii TaxID=47157 RepID=UPI000413F450|nr:class IV adenylate cyclase [Maridesulfovibrio bastinii]